jgi:hypothetical protein
MLARTVPAGFGTVTGDMQLDQWGLIAAFETNSNNGRTVMASVNPQD